MIPDIAFESPASLVASSPLGVAVSVSQCIGADVVVPKAKRERVTDGRARSVKRKAWQTSPGRKPGRVHASFDGLARNTKTVMGFWHWPPGASQVE